MAKTYTATRQWDHWLAEFLGVQLLEEELRVLKKLLSQHYGKHTLLVGAPHQSMLLKAVVTNRQYLLTPFIIKNNRSQLIEGDFYDLPISSGSVDLVLLPHSLEYMTNPRQLLTEACRIVKPEGHIVILGFNPFSFWGLKKLISNSHQVPWLGNFISAGTIKKWLSFADFELTTHEGLMFNLPVNNPRFYRKLKFLEWFWRKFFKPFGGVYILIAKAKVTPLTPIRMRWQQKLSSAQLIIPRPTMRDYPS